MTGRPNRLAGQRGQDCQCQDITVVSGERAVANAAWAAQLEQEDSQDRTAGGQDRQSG